MGVKYMIQVSIWLAFSAGILSFLSPCVLPLVPAYISYLAGTEVKTDGGMNKKAVILLKAVGFVIGFSLIFIVLGASVTTFSKLFIKNQEFLRKTGAIIIILFGVHTTGLIKFEFLRYERKFHLKHKISGTLGSLLMGMAFAAGWTPCVGPILSSILIYASTADTISSGILLLWAYSLGMAVPFLLSALAVDSLSKRSEKISKAMPAISVLSGIILIAMGFLIYHNKVSMLSAYFSFIN